MAQDGVLGDVDGARYEVGSRMIKRLRQKQVAPRMLRQGC